MYTLIDDIIWVTILWPSCTCHSNINISDIFLKPVTHEHEPGQDRAWSLLQTPSNKGAIGLSLESMPITSYSGHPSVEYNLKPLTITGLLKLPHKSHHLYADCVLFNTLECAIQTLISHMLAEKDTSHLRESMQVQVIRNLDLKVALARLIQCQDLQEAYHDRFSLLLRSVTLRNLRCFTPHRPCRVSCQLNLLCSCSWLCPIPAPLHFNRAQSHLSQHSPS